MRIVPIDCIREGAFLGKTIYDQNGNPLLKAGTSLNKKILDQIKKFNIYSLYIIDNYIDTEIEDIIKPELRNKTIKLLKETFSNIYKFNNINNNETTRRNLHKKNLEYFKSINEISEELIDNILRNKDMLVSLIDIKNTDNYTYQHSVNVAVISLIIGIGLNLDKNKLITLCSGALLHDIGKIFIPKYILNKPSSLTHEEYEIVKNHPKLGYEHLKRQSQIKTSILLISLQHHERIDGTGYPYGLTGEKIHYLSKIVSLADVYDALTSDRSYRRALSASDAIEYIMGNVGKMFDFDIVNMFTKLIVPFPFGTIVRLSNGDVGIVQETPAHFPLRPSVKILKSNDIDSEGNIINLVDELTLVISNIENNI